MNKIVYSSITIKIVTIITTTIRKVILVIYTHYIMISVDRLIMGR